MLYLLSAIQSVSSPAQRARASKSRSHEVLLRSNRVTFAMPTLGWTTLAELVVAVSVVSVGAALLLRPSISAPSTSEGGASKSKKKKKAAAPKPVEAAVRVEEPPVAPVVREVPKAKAPKPSKSAAPAAAPAPKPAAPALAPRAVTPPVPSTAPSFASIATPSDAKTNGSARPSSSANPMRDMRDLDVDPRPKVAAVIKLVDSRPPVGGSSEWQQWAEAGEQDEDEGEWEVAKKSESRFSTRAPAAHAGRSEVLTIILQSPFPRRSRSRARPRPLSRRRTLHRRGRSQAWVLRRPRSSERTRRRPARRRSTSRRPTTTRRRVSPRTVASWNGAGSSRCPACTTALTLVAQDD